MEARPEQAWALLVDVPRVIPCMPGAELAETLGGDAWKATLSVRLGPMTMTFDLDVAREETDEAARRSRLLVKARDVRGRGGAAATIDSSLFATARGTRVDLVTELTMQGVVAQLGRPVANDVATQLVTRFADCVRDRLAATEAPEPDAPAPARPIHFLSILLGSLKRLVRRG